MHIQPLVSVCIPSYNAVETLGQTLDSLMEQTYANIEILVSDNASTDETANLVRAYSSRDSRIKLFKYDKNIGGEGNFTRCMHLGNGEFTAIFHSDDIYHPEIVRKQVDFFNENGNIGAVFTNATLIDGNGTIVRKRKLLPPEIRRSGKSVILYRNLIGMILIYGNFLVCPSAMVRSRIYKEEIMKWEVDGSKTSADLDVWLRIAKNNPIGYLNEPLICYRFDQASYSYRNQYVRTSYADFFKVMDRYLDAEIGTIGKNEHQCYEFIKLIDAILCARNMLISGEINIAQSEMSKLFRKAFLFKYARCFDDVKILFIGIIVYLLSVIPGGEKIYRFYHQFKDILKFR